MGVWVYPNIVQKVNGKVSLVKERGIPKPKRLFELVDLIGLYRKSLISIASADLDLAFFDKANACVYGNVKYEHVSFSPEEVLHLTNTIRKAFEENGEKEVGEILEWTLKSGSFYDLIKPEIEHIEELCEYAEKNGYELQLIVS